MKPLRIVRNNIDASIEVALNSNSGSIGAFEIISLLEQKRISKADYIQLAITLEFGVNGRPVFENQGQAEDFVEQWSSDEKSGRIKPSDLWSAIAKYLKQFDDGEDDKSYPLLDYLGEMSK